MKSMTGYAKRQCTIGDKKLQIEIKTLNSKQMDANVKIPAAYRGKELEIRNMLNTLERGKIDFIMTEETTDANSSAFNKDLVTERYRMLTALAQDLGCSHDGILNVILSQPEIWKLSENDDINEDEWNVLVQAITVAIEETDQFRIHEGAFLEKDFIKHIDTIEQKLKMIPQYEEERITTAKERIKKYMTETGVKDIDENRFEQELIYYLEKLDITEEKVRLQKHIDYFRHTMEEDGSGKKLGFIAQEMGREINTTGSKANHIEIQKLVVEMKDELEKIKEQLGNIL